MNERQIEKILEAYLEDNTLEEFFEYLDITPLEVIMNLYKGGLISDQDLESLLPTDA